MRGRHELAGSGSKGWESGVVREGTYEFSGLAEVVAFGAPLGFATIGSESLFGEEDEGSCYVIDVDD